MGFTLRCHQKKSNVATRKLHGFYEYTGYTANGDILGIVDYDGL
jgi:hypothetical protein